MKIAVKNIEPNPYRQINKYPIDRAKVGALKTSIKEKTFWDNILVRKHGSKYQLAYGHHRLVALKELGIKEINVPVRKIDDATMIKIMAEENLNWSTSPAVMTQTILTTKEFLDGELAKYETWEGSGDFARPLFSEKGGFQKAKKEGVGRDTLVKFLGGNWTGHKVRVALDIIKDKSLDKKAVETIPTMEQARVFRTEVKKHDIPKPTQKKIAKEIAKEGVGRRDIPDLVAEHAPSRAITKKAKKPKTLPNIIEFLNKCEADSDDLSRRLQTLKPHLKEIVKNKQLMCRIVPALKQLRKTVDTIVMEYESEKKRKDSVICQKR